MLKNTTIIIQAHKVIEPTLSQALAICPNVIIFNDKAKFKHDSATVVRGRGFSGKYEDAYEMCLPLVQTEFVCRINGGDEILDLQEPTGDIWLARYNKDHPDHKMDKDYFKHAGASIISGSVIKTEIMKDLLDGYTVENKAKWGKFGKYCGDIILNSEFKISQAETQSLDFTFKMWGSRENSYKV